MIGKIGIIAEHKPGEGRIPLTPAQIHALKSQNANLEIVVQSSAQRAFKDAEFSEKSIELTADLSDANLVMAVKEIDVKDIHSDQAYLYFSHTIKGQDYNMGMLQHILDVGATLLDYELIANDEGRRLVFFGRHAGLAGMVNTLWSYGQRLKAMGISSPFSKIQQTQDYADLNSVHEALQSLAPEISTWMRGKPPLVIGLTGYGNVSQGAQEILDDLPFIELAAKELLEFDPNRYEGEIIKVVFEEEDMFEPKDPDHEFELHDYFKHPEKYRAKFYPYLQYLNILVNCIYWDTPYPRLIDLEQIKAHYEGEPSLRVVGDITCDIDGAIQFNSAATKSSDPVYVYDPVKGTKKMGFSGEGVALMAVDNLPTELPREASEAFGDALKPFAPAMANCDFSESYDGLELPAEIKKAVIAHKGKLTPNFAYLSKHL